MLLTSLPPLRKGSHATHCKRCLSGLPSSQVDIDPAKLALSFYCLGSLDVSDELEKKAKDWEREQWREWIWSQQTRGPYGTGFRSSSYMTAAKYATEEYSDHDTPQIIMTYTALLSLSILRDNFSRLDRKGLLEFLRSCQNSDGSFSSEPLGGDSDLRTTFCAFSISIMLDDWSGMDVTSALQFISTCRTYEGGYGQSPFGEALGGTTYCALASLQLAQQLEILSSQDRQKTVRWLVQNQASNGGFRGRTNKDADACYCFWCGASLHVLGASDLVDKAAMSSFIASCQFKYGGIAKIPGEHPDPYHTYLSLAAVALLPPDSSEGASWALCPLDPLLNATYQTSSWARAHIPAPKVDGDNALG
ncbi:terpenoid cyclases/protein prenyltransferase alpha-alpha toroid [Suillus paluster]|uniref:terpenoid cyclases/protein prenyltransferase alpha-alpha toroid n=1 Tax=Suillus paluster TaxID=48578 RepID=UPI001B8752F6|nr:terpenoid cyclases/protein prenyltransferase alpha-alpha toroid [Suillus paluster]KAG1743173.1 terpenoid cyclases/protein prenyltransferase alpha-alpha toroid [Suillus paluster]